MSQFNIEYDKYYQSYGTPEDYYNNGSLVVDSPDVFTFIYFLKEDVLVYCDIGISKTHQMILKEIKEYVKNKTPMTYKVLGDINKLSLSNITPDNTLTGRAWIDNAVISFWNYIENNFITKKYLKNLMLKIKHLFPYTDDDGNPISDIEYLKLFIYKFTNVLGKSYEFKWDNIA